MIDATFQELSIRQQCTVLGVSKSSYYYEPSPKLEDQNLMNFIQEIWLQHPFYGYRKIKAVLTQEGYVINHKKVQRLMKEMNLAAIYPKPKMSMQSKEHLIYPYLLNDVLIIKANQVWATDITYIKMQLGFLYLLAIIDLYSRYIVGHAVSTSLEADFCIETLQIALSIYGNPEIFNTDQGSQFTSNHWIKILIDNKVKISMDGKGRCFDNIFVERLWRTIKYEEVYLSSYDTVTEARVGINEFVEFYNYKRPHQSLKYKTPAEIYLLSKERIV